LKVRRCDQRDGRVKIVVHSGNSPVFPGACSHLRLAAGSPVLPGTSFATVEPHAPTIHSANPQRISRMDH